MRILLSAFACAPARGSEPNIGWALAYRLAAEHSVWVLTDGANEEVVRGAFSSDPPPGLRFAFVRPPRWMARRRTGAGFHHLYYLAWQISAFYEARRLHRKKPFDLVHHVTYVNSWLPSFMGFLGVPFIWSAGSRERTPWSFLTGTSARGRVAEIAREIAIALLWPLTRVCTASRASLILCSSSSRTWSPSLPTRSFPLGGLTLEEIDRLAALSQRREPLYRVASIGRLLSWKGFAMGLRAFDLLHQEFPQSEYWIIGEGQERPALEKIVKDLRCRDAVRFFGWLPRDELLRILAQIDVLLHPSLREQFGYVLLESMAAGKPVVCLSSSGSPALLNPSIATIVPLRTQEQVIRQLHLGLLELALNPVLREERGSQARAWARDTWVWDSVMARLSTLYREVSRVAS